ncbi:hypothetical protein IPA_05430 [Ignicoccus pacificus DSM 13166]|uniref:4Fe-4S ferredoxin-type domain-containing protein n=1 Tax=Ignicoccus pacificus DSM 13166 TaxID=940294 RepID=A0A977KB92_9CREN|nr:hypothetical protein IPA_05430 [Ignicoccus pacificus DSM 13166]
MKRKWQRELEVFWCPELNVPVFRREDCEGALRLSLFEPRDLRIAWEGDYEYLSNAFDEEVGKGSWEKLTEGRMVFLNRTSYVDHAYQIIVDGDILARALYDPLAGKWRIRLGYLGALRALERGYINSIKVDNPRPGDVVGKGNKQVALVDSEGKVVGIAIPKRGKLRVDKVWKHPRRGALSTRKQDLKDILKANERFIEELREWSFEVLKRAPKGTPILSLSGGKDSALVAQLLKEYDMDAILLFNDTGIELPETIKTVEEEARFFNMKLEIASAEDRFWRAVDLFSPPARDFRWCCKVLKLGPIARFMKRYENVTNFVGNRWWESLERSRTPPIMKMKYFPTVTTVSPILPWPQLLELAYLIDRNVPLNELYFKGFDRVGCFMCPGATQWEYELVKRLHPELWERWENVLEKWRKRLGYGKWWIRGGWRWLAPEHPKEVLASKAGETIDWKEEYKKRQSKVKLLDYKVIREKKRVKKIILKLKYDKVKALELAKLLGTERRGQIIEGPRGRYEFYKDRVIVSPKVKGIEEAFEALRVVHSSNACAGCRICETWCPTGAIKVIEEKGETRPVLADPNACEGCRLCMYLCPSADIVADRLFATLLYNNPKAWKRSQRPHKEVVQRLAEGAWRNRKGRSS